MILKKVITSLIEKIQLPNNTFVHRDFHVSNLMFNNNKISSNRFTRCCVWKHCL